MVPTPRQLRESLTATTAALALVIAPSGFVGCAWSAPRFTGAPTDHFDGKVFHNPGGRPMQGVGAMLRWQAHRDQGPWRSWVDAPPGPPPPRAEPEGALRVTFVNHATTLVQMDGVNILTDPIWSERCSPVTWAGPRRVRPPGIRFEDLPHIDAVVISHDHYDHMDIPTLSKLQAVHHPRIFVLLGNRAVLDAYGVRGSEEMEWWQTAELSGGMAITAVPSQHFSNRSALDRNFTLWGGFVFHSKHGNVYFAGDTAEGPHFAEIAKRLSPIRLAILPIGAFQPEWIMSPIHMSPLGALRAHYILHSRTSVAMHFGTFPLADDGEEEPPKTLIAAVEAYSRPQPRFWVLGFGEGRDVPALGQ